MSKRFATLASDAKNAEANSAAVCGTGPLKSLRTVRARGFVTTIEQAEEGMLSEKFLYIDKSTKHTGKKEI